MKVPVLTLLNTPSWPYQKFNPFPQNLLRFQKLDPSLIPYISLWQNDWSSTQAVGLMVMACDLGVFSGSKPLLGAMNLLGRCIKSFAKPLTLIGTPQVCGGIGPKISGGARN